MSRRKLKQKIGETAATFSVRVIQDDTTLRVTASVQAKNGAFVMTTSLLDENRPLEIAKANLRVLRQTSPPDTLRTWEQQVDECHRRFTEHVLHIDGLGAKQWLMSRPKKEHVTSSRQSVWTVSGGLPGLGKRR